MGSRCRRPYLVSRHVPICQFIRGATMPKGGWTEKPEEAGLQEPGEAGAAGATSVAMVELLREQLKAQQTQQEMLMTLLDMVCQRSWAYG